MFCGGSVVLNLLGFPLPAPNPLQSVGVNNRQREFPQDPVRLHSDSHFHGHQGLFLTLKQANFTRSASAP
jgi:hypothetical protein